MEVKYSVKMRSEKNMRHTSGAERIVPWHEVDSALLSLVQRASNHSNGEPDSITLTIARVQKNILTLPSLPVFEPIINDQKEAKLLLNAILEGLALPSAQILGLFYSLSNMRGAAMLDAESFKRLEPDHARGIRVTELDYEGRHDTKKNHFKEALCLASKVAHCPFIMGELCMSDDPDYTTGYFASKTHGYIRIPHIKEMGDPRGGRIFLFKGMPENLQDCIEYLEQQPVMVTGIKQAPQINACM